MGVIYLSMMLVSLVQMTSAGVTMEVKFIRYVNPGGEGDDGECCDGKWGICGSSCDHEFNICLDKAKGKNNVRDCPFGKFKSSEISDADTITFGSSFGGVKNPMFFRMTSWPGSVKLKVEVYDADHNSPDRVDFVHNEISEKVATDQSAAVSSSYTLKARTTLSIKVKTYCDKDFYGAACDTFCVAHNDTTGHYTCDETDGERVCLPGWHGQYCDDDGVNECMENNTCHDGHVCLDKPVGYECACPLGTSGTNCTSVDFTCDDTPCKNGGNCSIDSGNLTCACVLGWTGLLCEEPVDPCAANPCANNGTCLVEHFGFSCTCHEGYGGPDCNETILTTTTLKPEETTTLVENTTVGTVDNVTSVNVTSDANSTEPTTQSPGTTTEPHSAYIMFKGRLLGDNTEDVTKGIQSLIVEQMKLRGQVEVTVHNIPEKLSTGEILTKLVVSVRENDEEVDPASIQKIFRDTELSVLEHYIPLPIYRESSPETQPLVEEHNSWIHNNWYIVLVAFVVVIALGIFLTGFIVYHRKKSVRMGQKDVVARPASDVTNAIPAQSFENSLYFEMNNHQRKSSNTRVKVNVNPTS